MKKIFLTIFLSLCFCACANAAQWERYGAVFVDITTVTKTANSIQGWVIRPDFAKSKPIHKTYLYEAALIDARCNAREMATLNTAWYDTFHQLVHSEDFGQIKVDHSYIRVKPKTNAEVIFNALCKQKVL